MLELDYTLKTVLGYVLSFGYSALIVIVGELLWRSLHISKTVARKIEHLMTCVNWVIGYLFFGPNYHLVIMNGVSTLVLVPLVLGNVFKAVEREDTKASLGIIWFALSTFITASLAVFVNNDWYVLTGIPYYCMALGDGLAPLAAGLADKKNSARNIKLFHKKSLVGMLTVLTVSLAVCVVFNYTFDLRLSWLFMISLACLAAMIELYSLFGADNLTIELLIFGYLVANYYGVVPAALEVSFIIGVPVIVVAVLAKALSPSGLIVSFIYFSVISYCLEFTGLVMLVLLFSVEAVISMITTKIFNGRNPDTDEKTARNGMQIFSTGFGAICGAILYSVFRLKVFLFAAVIVIVAEFSDSISSDIGRLSKQDPVDILRFKRVPAGISGGVSLVGSVAGVIMAFVSCAASYIFVSMPAMIYFILVGIAVLGVFLDSILGAWLQALYRCPTCDILTEHPEHCNGATVKIKGLKCITNSIVNLITGIMVCGITVGILWALCN